MSQPEMNTHVLSLKESLRRTQIEKELKKTNIRFSFVDAIDKKHITENVVFNSCDQNLCKKNSGRSLVSGEIACYLGHLKIWEIVAASCKPALVLEDDAKISKNINTVLFQLNNHKVSADIVILGHSKLSKKNQKKHYFHNPIKNRNKYKGDSFSFSIGSVFKLWTSGTVGYYVTPEGAQKLISLSRPIKCVVDDWGFYQKQGLNIKEIRPYIIWEDFENLPSDIEHERKVVAPSQSFFKRTALEPIRFFRAVIRNTVAKFI